MKIAFLTLLIVLTLCLPFTFAQDASQWHLPEGAKTRLGKGWVTQVEFSPDGTRLAVAGSIGIWIYDARTYQEIALLTGHTVTVESISFSKDGKMLASGSRNRTIRLWDVPKGELRKTLIGHLGDVAMGELRKTFGNIGQSTKVLLSGDGKTLAGASHNGTILLQDVVTGELLHSIKGHKDRVNSISFSWDGKMLASAGGPQDKTVRIWDVATGELRHTLTEHVHEVLSVAFSGNGTTLASGGRYGLLLWDVATGKLRKGLTGHTDWVNSVALNFVSGMLQQARYEKHSEDIRIGSIALRSEMVETQS